MSDYDDRGIALVILYLLMWAFLIGLAGYGIIYLIATWTAL